VSRPVSEDLICLYPGICIDFSGGVWGLECAFQIKTNLFSLSLMGFRGLSCSVLNF
jgi:hypothetical protein